MLACDGCRNVLWIMMMIKKKKTKKKKVRCFKYSTHPECWKFLGGTGMRAVR